MRHPAYSRAIGNMREELVVQRNDPPTVSVSSVTRSSATATATTASAHGYATGDYVTHAGADQTAYNGKAKITVTGPTTYTYPVSGSPATPATGTITAVYASNAQGGQGVNFWRTFDTIAAEMIPIKASERLQLAAIQSDTTYRFRIYTRGDVVPSMRVLWTPNWPPDVTPKTLTITGVIPDDTMLAYQMLEAAEVAA